MRYPRSVSQEHGVEFARVHFQDSSQIFERWNQHHPSRPPQWITEDFSELVRQAFDLTRA